MLTEELTTRENRRVRMAVQMARLSAIKTLAGFDFAFQPSLDRNRILASPGLQFIDRAEALHLIGPPGTGKTHLSLALGVEAGKTGRSVYFSSLADIVASLAKAERDGALRERIRYYCRFALVSSTRHPRARCARPLRLPISASRSQSFPANISPI